MLSFNSGWCLGVMKTRHRSVLKARKLDIVVAG